MNGSNWFARIRTTWAIDAAWILSEPSAARTHCGGMRPISLFLLVVNSEWINSTNRFDWAHLTLSPFRSFVHGSSRSSTGHVLVLVALEVLFHSLALYRFLASSSNSGAHRGPCAAISPFACWRQSDIADAKRNISHAYGIHKISTETSLHVYYLRPLFLFSAVFCLGVCVSECVVHFAFHIINEIFVTLSLYPRSECECECECICA